MALALAGLGVASCTQNFDQFEPTGGSGGNGGSSPCPTGQVSCNDTCVSADDPAFGCGTGCTPCNVPHATAACVSGACAVGTCNAGFSDCDGLATSGCESDTATDPNNCGACGTVCTAPNAMPTCAASMCGVGPCTPGFADCDMMAETGCETNTESDPQHCGGCDSACTVFETCTNGGCEPNPCEPGTADCNMDNADGCETTLGTLLDCNFCGDVCDLANAAETCDMGACTLGACDGGFADCDMMGATGCEVNLQNDPMNCGACSNVCPGGALAACTNGMCGIECAAGTADCNNDPSDGCEVNTQTDVMHCGACGHACSNANASATVCTAGACVPTCNAGSGDCTKPMAPAADDGCETNTATSVDHCGACGRACSGTNVASKSCAAGVCDSSCDLGFANCDMPAMGNDDGCELNTQQNDTNCGGCGNDCSGTLDCDRGPLTQKFCGCNTNNECGGGGTCNGGTGLCACLLTTCAAGEVCGAVGCSCNGGAACGANMLCCQSPAGCVNPYTDAANCGACGRECPTGFVCGGMAPQAPTCRCDADADCNAGSAGTCGGNGQCTCGGTQCAVGERCLPNGMCG
ncbi:hypothetical protein [Polyangium jinanense]|uniref:4Fe-4S ferredoxin-type domain-containing protein n=1 Tax=Polyangium jinanense TaxID=2829994 RepID=A0A9X4ANS8_9BACT|nr:hypothetical protein [Polyangium jinanense]MDC3953641.1 hypothetical protein [Polyangium jinanense]MDC3979238.1 hypothetical protein [Polyangium jinanense]